MTKHQKRKKEAPSITPRKLIEYVSAERFRPFRINMASGQTFDVRHPENVAVSRSSVRIFASLDDSTADERWHDVSLMLMESVEPLDASVAQDQN
jgi:hypothetical protein